MTISRVLAQYQLLRSLGAGWLGEVYAATDLDDGKTYAVRVLSDANTAQAHLLVQLDGLLRKVMSLTHPHVLPVDTLVERDHRAFYRMAFAERGSVRQLLQFQGRAQEPLDLLVALDLGRQAASALAYAHEHDLMHGNLKPENLLLQPGKALLGRGGYTLQVSDFGLAELRAASYGTQDHTFASNLTYLSPEQCRGVRNDHRTDIYALGVILYELVTGMVPFETKDAAEAFERHQYSAPVQPSTLRKDLPEDIEEVILTCLAKKPEHRPATARELEGQLQAIINRMLPSGPEPTVVLPPLAQPPKAPRVEAPKDRLPHPRLLIYGPDLELQRIEVLEQDTVTVGRAPGNDVLLEHAGISRHHLSLEFRPEQAYVTDLNATNTSVMDGVPLPSMTPAAWPYGELLYVRPYWLYLHAPYRVAPQPRIVVNPEVLELTLTPGLATTLPLLLVNTGKTVDHFMLSVEGVPEHWVQNAYFEVQLNPGMQGQAALQLFVPRTPEALAGEYPVTVLARSRENPEEYGRAPMKWTVLPYYDTQAELTPNVRRAWFRTWYELSVKNAGNTPVTYSPTVKDDEDAVRLLPTWQEVFVLPASGNLSNVVNLQALLNNMRRRVLEGLGKIRVEKMKGDLLTEPGEDWEQRVKVRLPIRWVGTSTHRDLRVLVQADKHDPTAVAARLQHNPLIPLWLLPILMVLGLLGFWWVSRPPEITQFALSGNAPLAGQAFKLNWQTQGARSVRLLQQHNTKPVKTGLKGSGETQMTGIPDATIYTLVAKGWWRESRRDLTVAPKFPAPIVKVFKVVPQQAMIGKTVTVVWEVDNVKQVQLEPLGTVAAKGKIGFKLDRDTAFQLQATGEGGSPTVTKKLDATILPPTVTSFQATPQSVTQGDPVTLRWQVQNATRVSIDQIGPVPASGQITVRPTQNVTYTIKAGNGVTEAQETASISVGARPPTITAFSVSPSTVQAGRTVRVSWATSNAQSVQLMTPTGAQTVPASGSLNLTAPDQPGEYSLTAANTAGQQTTARQSITVLVPPPAPEPVAVTPPPTPTETPPAAPPAPPTPAAVAPAKPAAVPTTGRPAPQTGVNVDVAPEVTPLKILTFRVDKPQITGPQRVTLTWDVQGVKYVRIPPLVSALGNNRFPARGQITLNVKADSTYTLLAGDPRNPARAVARVNYTAPPRPAQPEAPKPVAVTPPPPAPPASPPATTPTAPRNTNITPVQRPTAPPPTTRPATPAVTGPHELDGQWEHSQGSLSLRIIRDGRRATGSFTAGDRTERGSLSGVVSGTYTISGRINAPGTDMDGATYVITFSQDRKSFIGTYTRRAQSERWCGWRPGTPQPQECR